ncbi:deazapurine DNA modification protein DpdA family protein [Nocardia sp. IFM 10818]
MSGPRFYLGSNNPAWLARAGVPLCISDVRLERRVRLPRAVAPWMLDSGAFSRLQYSGRWTITAAEYADRVRRYRDTIGLLAVVSPMDEMCERPVIYGGTYDGQTFVGTRQFIDPRGRLSYDELVAVHQHRTVENLCELRAIAPDLDFIPVLQGFTLAQYLRCIDFYRQAGIDLTREPLVGLGSICRRQNTAEIHRIVWAVRARGVHRLHGYGIKIVGLRRYGHLLTSADSVSWSLHLRRKGRPVCGQPHPRGAKTCTNCLPAALDWYHARIAELSTATPELAYWDEPFTG